MIRGLADRHYDKNLKQHRLHGNGRALAQLQRCVGNPSIEFAENQGWACHPSGITVSTAGIAKAIKRLGDDEVRFNLALSLHAANDEKRNRIMAINESNNLEALAEALKYFHERTGTRVTYEYIIFKDFNDDLDDARELAAFCETRSL